MHERTILDFGRRARSLRVDTLVRLRWLAIAGQLAAVLLVRFEFGFVLPLDMCLSVIAVSAILNIALRIAFPRTHRLADRPAAMILAFDLAQLAILLYLTGGIENPFIILALAPVMISAVSLPGTLTGVLLGFMVISSLVLTQAHLPLPWDPAMPLELPLLYSIGVWVALCLGGAFVCFYANRVADESRRLSDALAATELVLVREQHLTQLDGLAAAAAHELGTPLATITLVVNEIARSPERPVSRDDIDTIAQQTARCRDILRTLTSLESNAGGMFDEMSLAVLLEEAVAPHRNFGVAVVVDTNGPPPEPRCRRSPGVLYGLGNFIDNAVDFATTAVAIHAHWSDTRVTIQITDDGPGFSPDILMQAGEPYVTSRSDSRRAKSDESSGLGLGLFIGKSLLERSGATIKLANNPAPAVGARITIEWPRTSFETALASRDDRSPGRRQDETQAA
jgi:two-component system sensor histidine kinase RegB